MTIQELLTSKGYVENQDYTYDGTNLVLIEKTRQVEFYNTETQQNEIRTENYFEPIAPLRELKGELLGEEDSKIAIETYLSDKRHLINIEEDSINHGLFLKNDSGWRYSNIPVPSIDYLLSILPAAKAEQQAKQDKEDKIKAGRDARQICEKVLDLIAGYNLARSLTIQQITQLQSTLSSAESALRAGRPSLAKSLITAITPDEVLVTAEMKSAALELLVNY